MTMEIFLLWTWTGLLQCVKTGRWMFLVNWWLMCSMHFVCLLLDFLWYKINIIASYNRMTMEIFLLWTWTLLLLYALLKQLISHQRMQLLLKLFWIPRRYFETISWKCNLCMDFEVLLMLLIQNVDLVLIDIAISHQIPSSLCRSVWLVQIVRLKLQKLRVQLHHLHL